MKEFKAAALRVSCVTLIALTMSVAGGSAQVTDSDSLPVSVVIGAPGTPTVTPEPTATPGGGSNGGGGSNHVTRLPSTGSAQDDGSDLMPALLVLTGGGLLAGSVLVGRRRTV